jgi:hypothetical protein
VPPTAEIWRWALYIGVTRGAVLGTLLGVGFCFAADSRDERPIPLRTILPYMTVPLLFAIAGSGLGAAAIRFLSEQWLAGKIPVMRGATTGAWLVYGMHHGVYLGAALGAMIACARLRRAGKRRQA